MAAVIAVRVPVAPSSCGKRLSRRELTAGPAGVSLRRKAFRTIRSAACRCNLKLAVWAAATPLACKSAYFSQNFRLKSYWYSIVPTRTLEDFAPWLIRSQQSCDEL